MTAVALLTDDQILALAEFGFCHDADCPIRNEADGDPYISPGCEQCGRAAERLEALAARIAEEAAAAECARLTGARAVQAAAEGIKKRLRWASLHWGTEDVHMDAWPHIASAAVAALAQMVGEAE